MIALLLALAAEPAAAPGESQATLQSCDMTPSGWVCHYQMPSVTLLVSPDGKAPVTTTPASPPPTTTVPARTLPAVPAVSEVEKAETARQTRLVANCADANWLSLCLPADRKEARRLRDEMAVRAALRTKVTGLLSENKCDEAIKAALAGGDLPLAREARDFCTH